ncbi:MAG: glycoside hydrolase family 127 protein [Lachnospiraceae bacterium]
MGEFKKFNFASLRNSKLTEGFWGHRTENYKEIIECMLEALLCPTNSARLTNFEIGAGTLDEVFFGSNWSDGDCYKFLEGCLYVYQNTGDTEVKAIVDKYIPLIIGSAEEDGYLNTQITLTPKKRWGNYNFHELYNIGHFYTFVAAHYDITGEETLLPLANKMTDYLYETFKDYPEELGHFGFNPSQIMGLCEYSNLTGNDKAFELAEIFVNMRGSQPGGTDQNQTRTLLREETQAVGHAVTSTYLYSGAAEVYARTGEKALIETLERLWTDLFSKKIHITGGACPVFLGHSVNGDLISEAHCAAYELPNKIAYNETCANIGTAMWAMRMLALTEDTKYGDWAEQIMYNAGISGSNLSLTRYFYSNPLSYRKDTQIPYSADGDQHFNSVYLHKATRRWKTFDCWCCPPQLFRTMAGIGRWVYGTSEDTLYVNMFTSCDFTDETVDISMVTNYPWEDAIKLVVNKATDKKVKIRIPAWCKNPSVNGKAVTHGYYEMVVNTGDEITVILPMLATIMQANPNIEADRGMVCVKRGPVIYCGEGVDNEEKLDDLHIDVNGEIKATYEADLLDGVVTLAVPVKCIKQSDDLFFEVLREGEMTTMKMVPYYTWANREEADMSVWFPKM